MCKRNNDALFFTCSLIEQLGRSLHMRRGKVAAELGEAGIQTLYRNADILHCEPIEKVADDVITEFSLQGGDFDNLAEARYTVPDVWTMGKVYARLIEDVSDEDNIVETILQVFTSWIDSLLSDYNAAFYYQPRDYIAECYPAENGPGRLRGTKKAMVFYRNTHNSRGGNIIEDVPALCVYLSSSLYISHKRPAIIGPDISPPI